MGTSSILVYDFRDDSVSSPYAVAMERNDVRTYSEGLDEYTQAGNLVIEEENSGRLLILSAGGDLRAEFVNRSADGNIWTTSWSRPVSRADGDAVLAAMAAAPPCPGRRSSGSTRRAATRSWPARSAMRTAS